MDDNSYCLFVFSISFICSFSKICASFFFRKMNIPLCCHFTHNNNNANDNDNDRASAPMKAHSYDHPCTTKPPAAPPNPKSRYLLQKLYRKTLRPTRNLLPGSTLLALSLFESGNKRGLQQTLQAICTIRIQ